VSLPFLLEIGTEEIPDWMIEEALTQLGASFREFLTAHGLGHEASVATDATPRRLVLRAEGVAERQADREELVLGPPEAAAFRDGKPTPAAEGFARKQGIGLEAIGVFETARGNYVGYRKRIEGRPARDLLAEALPGMILAIHFPKTMYWSGRNGARFIRPIRWLVALLGEEVVPFEVEGVAAGRITRGHRRLGAAAIEVSIGNYEQRLRENFVLVAAAERRQRIGDGIARLEGETGLRVQPDAALIETLVYLTEYPTPILGSFDPEYLELPREVLVTVMRHHQRYLSLTDAEGNLAPAFIAVMNIDADREGLVRKGNERVLRARFNDARFFIAVDRQRRLADRVDDLAKVTFQARLGDYRQKTEENCRWARELAGRAGADPVLAERAALLAKCDLTTEMVKEFTELQGVMGGLYAQMDGEPEGVWRAVYEHYKPVSMEDAIPATMTGRIVSLADKLDTLRRCFSIGLAPSGSRDPFALRRAAQGAIRVVAEGELPFGIRDLAGEDATLAEFLTDRVRYYFREIRNFRYDEVNAVLAAGGGELVDLERRLEAIAAVRPTENFEPVAASFKRIQNILRQAGFDGVEPVDPSLLEPGPETELYQAFERVRKAVEENRPAGRYAPALEAIASLRPAVDLFFDKVLVNAQDARVRANRLALLGGLLREFSTIADFSEIVTAG
jgi:glycyl-tRNA synthetase beta chain